MADFQTWWAENKVGVCHDICYRWHVTLENEAHESELFHLVSQGWGAAAINAEAQHHEKIEKLLEEAMKERAEVDNYFPPQNYERERSFWDGQIVAYQSLLPHENVQVKIKGKEH